MEDGWSLRAITAKKTPPKSSFHHTLKKKSQVLHLSFASLSSAPHSLHLHLQVRTPTVFSNKQPYNTHRDNKQTKQEQASMYPQPQSLSTLLGSSTSNSLPRGVPTPPTTRIPAPASGGHYQYQPHLLQSQPYSFIPSSRPEDKLARLKRSNREIRETLERAETKRDDKSQRIQVEAKENPAIVAAPSLLHTFYSSAHISAPAPVAGFSRLSGGLGPPSYASLPQLYQQQPQQRHTYIDDGPNEYDSDNEGDSSPPLIRRTKKRRVVDPYGVTRNLAMANLDHIRFQVRIYLIRLILTPARTATHSTKYKY